MSSKKILIVASLSGFVRAFLLDDIKILQSMGYTVYCAANGRVDDRTLEENIDEFKTLGVSFVHVPFSSTNPFEKANWNAYKEIKNLLKNTSFDAIHVHTPIPGTIVRIAAIPYRKKSKVIYTTHGFYFHKGAGRKAWLVFYPIEKIMSLFCDAIITINREDYTNAKKMLCKKVYHISGMGVDTKRYGISINRDKLRNELKLNRSDIVILSIGELSERKNHQIIIKAVALRNNPNLIYLICGNAIEGVGTYTKLKELAEQLNVRVRFMGYRKDIPEICKASDIGAIPSTREGLGLAGIEMLAAGLPLVASRVHGIVDYAIEGKTAYLANPYSSKEFANCIHKLENNSVRKSMRQECVCMAKQFDMEVSHKQREHIYVDVLGHSTCNDS